MSATVRSRGAAWRGYLALGELAAREGLAERAGIIARFAFFAIIMLVFSKLWMLVLHGDPIAGVGPAECLWYLAITEWITLSQPPVHLAIEREVRTGEVACQMVRPLSYVAAKVAQGTGELGVRLIALAPCGILLGSVFSRGLPADARGLLVVLPLGALAALLLLLFHTLIGLSAFWLEDVSPTYWVYQKLAFLLGGLMLPLDIYPAWLREIAMLSPFSAALYGVGRLAFGFDPAAALRAGASLLAWIALCCGALFLVQRHVMARLEVNGG